MLRVQRMLKLLLQMNKSAGSLYQSFEEIRVARIGVEPKLFQNIMRLVVALLIPATEKCAIISMLSEISAESRVGWSWRVLAPSIKAARGPVVSNFARKFGQPLRNPLAFVHQEL